MQITLVPIKGDAIQYNVDKFPFEFNPEQTFDTSNALMIYFEKQDGYGDTVKKVVWK